MKYLKLYNKFAESVTIEEENSRNILEGDNFSLPKNLKFPEIEDLDMYLQLIEDDGYLYDVGEFLSKEEVPNSTNYKSYSDDKLKFGIHDICNYKYIKVISVELPRHYNLNEIDFLQEFKRKYFKSDKFDMRIDNVKNSLKGILKIKIIPKEIIDVKEIIEKFNTDVEKFLNDNKEILTGEIDSFGFSTIINNCVVSDLNNLKNKLEDFLDSYDYYVGVVLNRSRRMTFTISIDLVDSSE